MVGMLVRAIAICIFLTVALKSDNAFTLRQSWWLSTGEIPASYFGLTVESYNYDFRGNGGPIEAWPTQLGFPLTIVRSLAVWSPGDKSCCKTPSWNNIEVSEGVYEWAGIDAWVKSGLAHGVEMIFCLHSAPLWTGGGGTNPTPAQVTSFYSALATRYAGKIKYYEGFNEFNSSRSIYSGTIDQLVAIQKAMYQAVKVADPNAIVLSPTVTGLWVGGTKPYNAFLRAGGAQWFDVAAFHGYVDSYGETLVKAVSDLRNVLDSNGLSNIPIFDTEGAWQPDTLADDTLKTAFVIKAFVLEYWLGVTRKIWYAYDSANVGMLYNNLTGKVTNAGKAYIQVTQWLTGASLNGPFNIDSGSIWYGDLARPGDYHARVIWTPRGSLKYTVPAKFTHYRDFTGAKHPIQDGTVTLTIIPVLLENRDPQ
jgi:hypothetical protein